MQEDKFVLFQTTKRKKKRLPKSRPKEFYPMISSKDFMVLSFTFNYMIHFEISLVYGMKFRSKFMFLHMDIQLF